MNDESSDLLFPNTSTDPNTYYISLTLGTKYRAKTGKLLFPNTSTDPNTYYISLTLGTKYRAKTGNNVSEFTHSNWITQSYYSNLKDIDT